MVLAVFVSHPSRVRGLKSKVIGRVHRRQEGSHPSRVRGLKFFQRLAAVYAGVVAPFTGAWIEISPAMSA